MRDYVTVTWASGHDVACVPFAGTQNQLCTMIVAAPSWRAVNSEPCTSRIAAGDDVTKVWPASPESRIWSPTWTWIMGVPYAMPAQSNNGSVPVGVVALISELPHAVLPVGNDGATVGVGVRAGTNAPEARPL